ncbi:hypothetical protein [Halalkalicoccus ordinarius]|uniref:hypothetical protein n=1 Tax=Halalkalicoccus ordinarius TaxID=3116651 RepID=UPI00300E75FC
MVDDRHRAIHCHDPLMSSPPSHDPEKSEPDREEVLSIIADASHNVCSQTKKREVAISEDKPMLIKWYRTLATLSGQYRKLQKDTDIGEMKRTWSCYRKPPPGRPRGTPMSKHRLKNEINELSDDILRDLNPEQRL